MESPATKKIASVIYGRWLTLQGDQHATIEELEQKHGRVEVDKVHNPRKHAYDKAVFDVRGDSYVDDVEEVSAQN